MSLSAKRIVIFDPHDHWSAHHWPGVVKLSLGTYDLIERSGPTLVGLLCYLKRVVFEVAHLWLHWAIGDRMSWPDCIIMSQYFLGRIIAIHFLNCGFAWLLLSHQFSLLYYKLTLWWGSLFLIFLSFGLGFFIDSLLESTMFQLLETQ